MKAYWIELKGTGKVIGNKSQITSAIRSDRGIERLLKDEASAETAVISFSHFIKWNFVDEKRARLYTNLAALRRSIGGTRKYLEDREGPGTFDWYLVHCTDDTTRTLTDVFNRTERNR